MFLCLLHSSYFHAVSNIWLESTYLDTIQMTLAEKCALTILKQSMDVKKRSLMNLNIEVSEG